MSYEAVIVILSLIIATYVIARAAMSIRPVYALVATILIPIVSTPIWLQYSQVSAFSWAKVYTIFLTAALIFGTKMVDAVWQKRFYSVIYMVVFINILELVVAEYVRTGDLINPIAGAMLLIALPLPHAFKVNAQSGDVLYDVGWPFIAAYSVWNFVGIYNHSSGAASVFTLVHIGVPLLLTMGQASKYFQYRVLVLTILMLYWMYAPVFGLNIQSNGIYNAEAGFWLSVLSLAVALTVLVKTISSRLSRPADGKIAMPH